MNTSDSVRTFLAQKNFAVVGASQDREKYGNKVLRAHLQHDMNVVPINPKVAEVEGVPAVADLAALPHAVDAVTIITPPAITEQVVAQAVELGIKHLWMQPGAESPQAVAAAEAAGINTIHGGPCILVALGYHE